MKKQRTQCNTTIREGVQPLSNRGAIEAAEQQREAMLDGEPPGYWWREPLSPGEVNPLPETVGDEGGGSVHAHAPTGARQLRTKSDFSAKPVKTAEPSR